MFKQVQLSDIEQDGFLHSQVEAFTFNFEKKTCILQINFIRLKIEGSFYSCTITITDWWDFKVLHYKDEEIINKLTGNDIPELDSIVSFSYDGNTLMLEDLCGIEEYYQFVFTKPKIHITGEYDPD